MFDGFPRYLEQQTLLRVHALTFTRGNSKDVRVELVDLVQSTPPGILFPGVPGVLSKYSFTANRSEGYLVN